MPLLNSCIKMLAPMPWMQRLTSESIYQFSWREDREVTHSKTQRFELELHSWCNMPHVRLGGDTLHQEVRSVHVQGTEQNTTVFMRVAIAEVE